LNVLVAAAVLCNKTTTEPAQIHPASIMRSSSIGCGHPAADAGIRHEQILYLLQLPLLRLLQLPLLHTLNPSPA
jgi:hypothetical protein